MQPTTTIPDDLRFRYRRQAAPVRRVVQSDVMNRRVVSPPVTRQQAIRPQQLRLVTPQSLRKEATSQELFSLNLDEVAAAPQKRRRYLVKPHRLAHSGIAVVCLGLLMAGSFVSLQGYHANKAVAETVSHISKQAGGGAASSAVAVPSTDKPDVNTLASYKVAADMPRYLRITSEGVTARVRSLGLTKDGAVATPNNVYDSGWYNGSAKPGTAGASLIVGHVSSWTTHGVFYNLKTIKPGATLEIEKGDGSKLAYRVVRTQVYAADKVDMNAALTPVTSGRQGLNLITCTGKVKPGTSEFDQRLVVFTERVSS